MEERRGTLFILYVPISVISFPPATQFNCTVQLRPQLIAGGGTTRLKAARAGSIRAGGYITVWPRSNVLGALRKCNGSLHVRVVVWGARCAGLGQGWRGGARDHAIQYDLRHHPLGPEQSYGFTGCAFLAKTHLLEDQGWTALNRRCRWKQANRRPLQYAMVSSAGRGVAVGDFRVHFT